MKYHIEYQKFAKEITDKFILILSAEPQRKYSLDIMDDDGIEPSKEEIEIFYKKNNEFALKWLNENMVFYDEWFKLANLRDKQ